MSKHRRPYVVTCGHCGLPAQMARARGKYCSESCRRQASQRAAEDAIRRGVLAGLFPRLVRRRPVPAGQGHPCRCGCGRMAWRTWAREACRSQWRRRRWASGPVRSAYRPRMKRVA
jgi:hypothetical protein